MLGMEIYTLGRIFKTSSYDVVNHILLGHVRKTVRPMLSYSCLVLSWSVCPLCGVGVFGQMVGWIKMKLSFQVGLGHGHGHIVLDGLEIQLPSLKGAKPQIFGPCLLWPNGWMDQYAGFVVFLDDFDNKGRNVCCKVSLYKNCQRQSCSAFNCLSSGINILAGGRPLSPETLPPSDLPSPVNGILWEMSELITQERIAVGSSNLVEGLTT